MAETTSQQTLPEAMERLSALRAVMNARNRKINGYLGMVEKECLELEDNRQQVLAVLSQVKLLLQQAAEQSILPPLKTE